MTYFVLVVGAGGCSLAFGVFDPIEYTSFEKRIKRVVPQAHQPAVRNLQQPPLSLKVHLSEKERVLVPGGTLAVKGVLWRDGKGHVRYGNDPGRPGEG